MPPLVSILIPAYNSQDWIAETIESALAQTWQRKEVIIVDDGSRDQTLKIAKAFRSRAVEVVSQPNQGAAAARNTAVSLCQGDYIQWLDADDILEPTKVAKQLERRGDAPSGRTLWSGAWAYFRYRTTAATFLPTQLWCDLAPVEWLLRKMALNLHMQTDNWLVSRELATVAGPWDTSLFRDNDGEYLCRVILASDGIKFVPDACSYYRQAGFKSVSYIGGSNRKLESLHRSMTLHMEYLRSLEDTPRTRAACVAYIQNWLYEFYPFRVDLGEQLRRVAINLGGSAEPRLSWKYQWIAKLLGWGPARRVQLMVPKIKGSALIAWDRRMHQQETRKTT